MRCDIIRSKPIQIKTEEVSIDIDVLKVDDKNFTKSTFNQLNDMILIDPFTGEIDPDVDRILGYVNYEYKDDQLFYIRAYNSNMITEYSVKTKGTSDIFEKNSNGTHKEYTVNGFTGYWVKIKKSDVLVKPYPSPS